MSSSSPPNPHNIIAQQIAQPLVLTTEQKLFKEALKTVEERRRKQQDLPKIFDNLNHAQNLEDVKYLVDNERAQNAIWSDPLGKSWLKIFGDYAGYLLNYKVVLDAVVTRDPFVAAPIWATINFVINVFKDIGVAIEYLENTERTLSTSLRRFKIYVDKNIQISANLQQTLLEYYEGVIDFFVDVHKEFSQPWTKSTIRILHRTLNEKLKTFNGKIYYIIDDVDKGASIDMFKNLEHQIMSVGGAVKKMSVSPAVASAAPLLPALHMVYGLPHTSRNFTGQQQYLQKVWNLLHGNPQTYQRHVALYGMGGIGKTQILLRYAYDHIRPDALPHRYDAVIWINAISERSIVTKLSSFMEINGFHERLINDQQEISYTAFHTRLRQHAKNWLLIFDNVTDPKIVRAAIPPGNEGHILFSTRERLIAGQLSGASNCIEVERMDQATAVVLLSKLAAQSSDPNDRNTDTLNEAAKFADGLPLLIEQIVHNAILGRQGLARTLEDVRKKEQLLKQKNIASLHEKDLSLGALVLQTFENLNSQSPRAEALLKILSYLEASSMPLSLFSDCIGRVQDSLNRLCTYDRVTVTQRLSRPHDRTAGLQVPVGSVQDTKRHRFRSPFRRSKPSQDLASSLPLDDIEPAASLREVCGPATPLGQLFESKFMLESAFEVLVNASIIRKLNNEELWMHDRVSEVAKAIIGDEVVASQQVALTAATMVYIAFPTPGDGPLSRAGKTVRYLPHLMACHSNLKDLEILNNCSIGPELSHIIASVLDALGDGSLPYDANGISMPTEEQLARRTRVTSFYMDAYAGYIAGWRRLRTHHDINDMQIAQHIRMDRESEESFGDYHIEKYMNDRQRFGRHAPWRALQTACRLSDFLRYDVTTVELALTYVRAAINSSTIIFGTNDKDTIYLKRQLCSQLQSARRWQDAYDVSIASLKDYLEWRPGNKRHNKKIDFGGLWEDYQASVFANDLSVCCMALAKDRTAPARSGVNWARETVMWTEVILRHQRWVHGPEYFTHHDLISRLAEAYEIHDDPRAAVYWYGQAVFCRLSNMVWEREKWDSGPGVGAVPSTNEPYIRAVVRAYEEATLKYIGEGEGKLGNFDDLDVNFHKYLCAVKSMIVIWRNDRERFGVWDPYKEAMDKLQREFDEREEEIRMEEEELYGKIPPLHEVDVDDDQNKENLEVGHVEYTLTDVKSQDATEQTSGSTETERVVPVQVMVYV